MKLKVLILLICLWGMSKNMKGQNEYYDAISIAKSLDAQNHFGPAHFPALRKYYPGKTDNEIAINLSLNPFLKDFFDPSSLASFNNFMSTTSGLSSIGGINVTNFADGLAKFMVKRFKEELNLAFFQKFKDDLNDIDELKILFPETHKLLQAIDKEIYRYNIYIVTLREAFIKDLSNIFTDLRKLMDLPKYRNFLKGNPVLKTILQSSLYIVDGLSKGKHAGDIIGNFPVNDLKFKVDSLLNQDTTGKNMQGAVNTLKLFSASIKSLSPDRYWISSDSLALLFRNKNNITFRIYMGLIYQTAKRDKVTFAGGKNLTLALDEVATHLDTLEEYITFIEGLGDKAEEINEYISALKEKKKAEIDYNDYYKLFGATLDMMEKAFAFTSLPYSDLLVSAEDKTILDQKSVHWLFVARTASEIYVDARTRNYSSAVLNTTIILDTLVKTPSSKARQLVLKYGTFMATIAGAENSDQVATAIEAVALPVGGSGIKKHSDFNISIQTYLGGSYGSEKIKELQTNQKKNVASIFAPVGISFNWGLFKQLKNPASIGLHLNLLDIGALASFRFKDTATAINSTIQLKNILAPGAYIVVGLPKWPVSIGYGLQAGPQLREIKAGTPSIETEKIYTRSSFFLAVDIPLFTIYNRSR